MSDVLSASAVFILGLFFLVKGADYFVDSAAKIARILGVSELIIGLTLIALGTSLPELGAGIIASASNQTEIVLGNVLGSNIANIALILGLSSILSTITTQKEMFYRDGAMLIFVSVLFYYMSLDATITNVEGGILLVLFFLYNAYLFKLRPRIPRFREYVDYLYGLNRIVALRSGIDTVKKGFSSRQHVAVFKYHLKYLKRLIRAGRSIGAFPFKLLNKQNRVDYLQRAREYRRRVRELQLRKLLINDLTILVVSGAVIYVGAEFFVGGAVDMATILGVGPSVIGLTIVSVGTSLPELVVSLQSVRKGFGQMIIGNVLGSNIANISLIVGICSLIAPISLGKTEVLRQTNTEMIIPFMILVSVMGIIAIRSGWSIRRSEGLFFLLVYFLFLFWLISNPAVTM